MMNYYEFVNAVVEELRKRFSEETRVGVQTFTRNNDEKRDAFIICEPNTNAAPVIYAEEFYMNYLLSGNFDAAVKSIVDIYQKHKMNGIDVSKFKSFDTAKDLLRCKLINYESNQEFLQNIPYRRFLDLAMTCYIYVDKSLVGEVGNITVSKTILEGWDISEDELFRVALFNTATKTQYSALNMRMIFEDELGMCLEDDGLPNMYVFTNAERYLGAVGIAIPGLLSNIEKQLGGAFYILPSSIHECILIPYSRFLAPEVLRQMVQDVNQSQVAPEERLGNNVYIYKEGKVSIWTDKSDELS